MNKQRFICDCGNIYSSLAAIESCQNHHNQMKHDTPQEYYDQKDRCARLCVDAIKALESLCVDAIKALESLKSADLPYADKYKNMIAFIDTRLTVLLRVYR